MLACLHQNSRRPSVLRQVKSWRTAWSVPDDLRGLIGVHVIQRERRGKRQTSSVMVDEFLHEDRPEHVINMSDVRVDAFRASGNGGQHRNKTSSAIRMTHIPTGIAATATESRSQYENRRTAFRRLQERVNASDVPMETCSHGSIAGARTFVWTEWRDKVQGPNSSMRMSRALRGHLDELA